SVTLYGPDTAQERVGVVSMSVAGYDPQELAGGLDAAYRIQTRAGLHCAPRMHRSLGTLASGGTLRVSIGPFNTAEHIEAFLAALRGWNATAVTLPPACAIAANAAAMTGNF